MAGGEDVDQLVLAPRDRAGREGAQVEVGAAGRLIGLPVVGVDHDRPVQVGVVEHQRRVVRDQGVRGQAERLHARVVADVDDPAAGRGQRAAVGVVGAGQDDEARAQAAHDPLEIEVVARGAAVVAAGRRVQDRHRALGDAERGAQPGHVRLGRRAEHVVAGVAVLQRGVAAGVDALVGQGRVAVGGQHVVPLVDALEEPGEVPAAGRRRALLEVQPEVTERGAVPGLDQHLAPALDQAVVEVGVVDQVPGAGERRPVGGRAGDEPARAGRDRVVVLGTGDPRRADVRRQVAERSLQRARVAAVAAAVVRGEDGTVGAQREAALHAVVGPERGGPHPAPEPAGDPADGAVRRRRQLQGAVGAVQAEADQRVVHPGAQGTGRAGGAVAAVVGPGPAQEGRARTPGQPVPARVHDRQVVHHAPEQHRPPPRQFGPLVEEREDPVVLLEDVEVPFAGGAQDAALPPLPVVHADPVERRDRLRGHQHRVRPRRVLVPTGREGEPLLLDELPPVRLVPGHHQQPQQPRPVLQTERGRALLGELQGRLVADRLARPVGARVVEDQDVRIAGLLQPVRDRAQRVRREGVVAVEEQQVVAARVRHAGVAGAAQADVLGQVNGEHARVAGGELVDDRPARVRRAVVDDDQFQIGTGLGEHRFEALVQVRLNLVRGDNDTEPGQEAIHRSARAFGPGTAGGVSWLRRLRHPGDRRRGGPLPARPSNSLSLSAT